MIKVFKNQLVLSVLATMFVGVVSAQSGNVDIIKDNRIDALVKKQGEIIPPEVEPQINGYRIQIYFDSDREKVNDAKSRFISKFPKIETYIRYTAPNSILKVGDFRTQLEAERIKAQIEADFPTSFIVKEKIYLPSLEKQEL